MYGDLNLSPEMYATQMASLYGPAVPTVYQGAAVGGGYEDDEDDGYAIEVELGDAAGDDDEDEDDRWDRIVPQNRKLQGQYGLERQDGRHRMGDLLEAALTEYRARKRAGRLGMERPTFFKWLDDMPEWERIVMIRDMIVRVGGSRNADANLKPSMVKAFLRGVKYLDAAGRKRYELSFDGRGSILQNGVPFSTRELSTVHSGNGFAIWVLSKKNRFYAASHVKGVFHHSSFMSGEHVKCGGEMVVRDGKLLFLTAKSGHYQPPIANLVYSIRVLRDGRIPLDSFKVGVWRWGSPVAVEAEEFVDDWSGYTGWGNGKAPRKDWDPDLAAP